MRTRVTSFRTKAWAGLLAFLSVLTVGGHHFAAKTGQARRVFVVGTDNAPPYYRQNADGEIVGVAVDVFTKAAAALDLDLKFVHLAGQPDIFLRSHQADFWPVLTITDERKAEFHMTPPWLFNTFCLLHLSGAPVPHGKSLHLAHWTNAGNTKNAKTFFPEAKMLTVASRELVMRAVCTGSVDAGLIETRVLDSLLLARPPGCEGAKLSRQSVPGAAFPMGIAAVKSASREADQLQEQIARMAHSGELARIFEAWSSITANEANSILAMNAARQQTRLAIAALGSMLISLGIFYWQFRRAKSAYRLAAREASERKLAEEARRKADRTRTVVLEGAGEGICGLDAQGQTTFLNTSAARMLGLEGIAMNGHSFHELVHGTTFDGCTLPDCPLRHIRGMVGESFNSTGEFRRLDGSCFPVEFVCSPLSEDGLYTGSVITFKDISSRQQAEWLDGDRNMILEMLAENRGLGQIFRAISLMVERQSPGVYCAITTLSGTRLDLRAAPSLPVALREVLRSIPVGPDSFCCGTAANLGRPVIAPDIASDPHWEKARRTALDCGVRSCWSHPILSASGEVLGTVATYSGHVDGVNTTGEMLSRVACRLARLVIEQTSLTDKLNFQAHHDSLTGLPNRVLFQSRLDQALVLSRHTGSMCALFYIDLDRFKQINDTLSHRVGDLYLCQVVKRFERTLPPEATLARLGGDEFAVVIPTVEGAIEMEKRARALLGAMLDPFLLDGHTVFGTASVGISLSDAFCTAADLQSCADQAMYQAKHSGRNRFQFYSADLSRRAMAELEIEHCLRDALDHDQFVLHYQPQCRANGELLGFEALIRLPHSERGLIPPHDFIPVAEDTGLIVPIGSWVLRQACRQLATWRKQDLPAITMAVNVSALQLSSGAFPDEVSAMLQEFGLPPDALELELTESMIMENFNDCLAQMEKLRDLGVQLAIDDFGTGYSSLSYLHRLPIHTIKIDQSFVHSMDAEVSTRPLVEAILAAARSLSCKVIAEGVETEAQRRELIQMGCDQMQGYLFSRALPADEALAGQQFKAESCALALAS